MIIGPSLDFLQKPMIAPRTAASYLSPREEAFLQALLREEGHLLKGPATRTAEEHRLALLRGLEPANSLSPNLHGAALNRLRESASPTAGCPWDELSGDEVLPLLWQRLTERRAGGPACTPPQTVICWRRKSNDRRLLGQKKETVCVKMRTKKGFLKFASIAVDLY
jgi:hypothetical protein